MIGRLGNVLYWLCSGIAGLAAIGAAVAAMDIHSNGRTDYTPPILLLMLAVPVWLLGRAILYVLANR